MAIPKRQLYPTSKIKVGVVLFEASAWTDEDTGKTSSEVSEWVVRSIQAKRGSKTRYGFPTTLQASDIEQYVNITQKVDLVTWGKRSSKNGDYGWLKSIPDYYRKQFKVGAELPSGIYTTPRAAILYAVAETQNRISNYKSKMLDLTDADEIAEWQTELASREKELAALNRRLAKLSTQ